MSKGLEPESHATTAGLAMNSPPRFSQPKGEGDHFCASKRLPKMALSIWRPKTSRLPAREITGPLLDMRRDPPFLHLFGRTFPNPSRLARCSYHPWPSCSVLPTRSNTKANLKHTDEIRMNLPWRPTSENTYSTHSGERGQGEGPQNGATARPRPRDKLR